MRSVRLCPYKQGTFGHTQGEHHVKTEGRGDTSPSRGTPQTASSPPRPARGRRSRPCRFLGGGRLCRHLDLGRPASRTETIGWSSGAVKAGKPHHSGRSQCWDRALNVTVLPGGLGAGTCPLNVFSLPSPLSPHATRHGLLPASPINAQAGPPASRKPLERSILSGHQWGSWEPREPASPPNSSVSQCGRFHEPPAPSKRQPGIF